MYLPSPLSPQFVFNPPLTTGASVTLPLPLTVNPQMVAPGAPNLNLQAALKNMQSSIVVYLQTTMDFSVLFGEDGQLEKGQFLQLWKSIDASKEVYATVMGIPTTNIDAITAKLKAKNIFFIARRSVVEGQVRGVAWRDVMWAWRDVAWRACAPLRACGRCLRR